MTKSKRKIAQEHRARAIANAEEERKRKEVVEALRNDLFTNKTALAENVGVSRRTVQRLSKALENEGNGELEKLLDVQNNRPGKSAVLSIDEESMICERIQYCAARGFPIYEDELPHIIAQVADDGREGYKNGLPEEQTIRYFRARNSEKITLRKGQLKETSKLLAEHPSHAATYQKVFESIFEAHPELRTSPNHIWNMDETDVDGRGQVRKMYCASGAASTGYDSHPNLTNGPHLTCVVTTSPSGEKLPPFFIIAAKMVMRRWWNQLPRRANRPQPLSADIEQYFKEGWMPKDAGFAISENGSMTSDILPAYIQHFVQNARKVAPNTDLPLLLLLDGHKSRKGMDWIQLALKNNIEIAQSPANTSHYLQSNDQDINLILNKEGKKVRDLLVKETDVSPTNVNFKLVKAVHGHNAISGDIIKKSWEKIGLWPMDFRFVDFAQRAWDGQMQRRAENEPIMDLTVRVRESDASVCERLMAIVNNLEVSPERRIQRASMLLNNAITTNRILMDVAPGEAAPPSENARKNVGMRPPKGAGASAVYLTSANYISMFEEKCAEEKRKELEKEKKRIERAENQKRRASEKAQKQELKRQKRNAANGTKVGGASSSQRNGTQDNV